MIQSSPVTGGAGRPDPECSYLTAMGMPADLQGHRPALIEEEVRFMGHQDRGRVFGNAVKCRFGIVARVGTARRSGPDGAVQPDEVAVSLQYCVAIVQDDNADILECIHDARAYLPVPAGFGAVGPVMIPEAGENAQGSRKPPQDLGNGVGADWTFADKVTNEKVSRHDDQIGTLGIGLLDQFGYSR